MDGPGPPQHLALRTGPEWPGSAPVGGCFWSSPHTLAHPCQPCPSWLCCFPKAPGLHPNPTLEHLSSREVVTPLPIGALWHDSQVRIPAGWTPLSGARCVLPCAFPSFSHPVTEGARCHCPPVCRRTPLFLQPLAALPRLLCFSGSHRAHPSSPRQERQGVCQPGRSLTCQQPDSLFRGRSRLTGCLHAVAHPVSHLWPHPQSLVPPTGLLLLRTTTFLCLLPCPPSLQFPSPATGDDRILAGSCLSNVGTVVILSPSWEVFLVVVVIEGSNIYISHLAHLPSPQTMRHPVLHSLQHISRLSFSTVLCLLARYKTTAHGLLTFPANRIFLCPTLVESSFPLPGEFLVACPRTRCRAGVEPQTENPPPQCRRSVLVPFLLRQLLPSWTQPTWPCRPRRKPTSRLSRPAFRLSSRPSWRGPALISTRRRSTSWS